MNHARIILIGLMGAGKSSVGRALARRLQARFIDTDAEIERAENRAISQIFAEDGEAYFRSAEADVAKWLAEESARAQRALVVSTGGGMPVPEANHENLQRAGVIVWLRAQPQTLAARVGMRPGKRPLISDHEGNLLARMTDLANERARCYGKLARVIVETEDYTSPAQVAEDILRRLETADE